MSEDRVQRRIDLTEETHAPFGAGAFITGNVMIVGEQDSDPTASVKQRPFCTTKGCTGWLNKQLDDENIPEEKLFWVNALNNDNTAANLKYVVETMKPIAIVALGGIAQNELQKQEIYNFKPFYHPQYWKRFKSKLPYALIATLKELVAYPQQTLSEDGKTLSIWYKPGCAHLYDVETRRYAGGICCPYIPENI